MKPRPNFKLYSAKDPGKKKKRQVNNWKKIFANHTSYKVVVSVIYKELSILMMINNTIRKLTKDMNRYFTEESIQMANEHMKSCSISLAITEIHIKTTMRQYHIPTRMAKIFKILTAPNAGEDGKKRNLSYVAAGNVK